MAIQLTCDRCGKTVQKFAKSLIRRFKGEDNRFHHERYELCEECAQAFLAWLGKTPQPTEDNQG